MALIPLDIEQPVCAFCGQALRVGEHCLILEDDEGALFDAHAACLVSHAADDVESDTVH